jgi:hypothetical protein
LQIGQTCFVQNLAAVGGTVEEAATEAAFAQVFPQTLPSCAVPQTPRLRKFHFLDHRGRVARFLLARDTKNGKKFLK